MPQNVSIVNNTILSGRISGLRLGDPYSSLPEPQRPLVANNIFGVMADVNCVDGRFADNLMQKGGVCDDSDAIGQREPQRPGRADGAQHARRSTWPTPAYAPATDMLGHARTGAPDLGAIELVG